MITPTINVNLKPCECFHHKPDRITSCNARFGSPVLIPCPIPRSVVFIVALGPCDCPMGWAPPPGGFVHAAGCPSRPIRVACDISGETWGSSEVTAACIVRVDARGLRVEELATPEVLAVCRGRWEIVKALVLGHTDLSSLITGMKTAELISQRDAVFAALCEMARSEEAACRAQQAVDEAFPSARFADSDDSDHRRARPSVNRLLRFVTYVIEQVGALP